MKDMKDIQGKVLMMAEKLWLKDEVLAEIKKWFEDPDVTVVKVTSKETPVDIAKNVEEKMPTLEDIASMTGDEAKVALTKVLSKDMAEEQREEEEGWEDCSPLQSMMKKRKY